MYNNAILMGRICNDLEIKTTPPARQLTAEEVAKAADEDYPF